MNVDEIGSAIDGLVNEFGLPTITLPNGTAEGAPSTGGQVGEVDPELYHVYFTAGVHARERGGPDGLIYFISDLLHAQRAGSGLTYGVKTYSNAEVIKALNTGIVFFPLVNPDGVRYDQATDSLWRKNRNPASGDGTPALDRRRHQPQLRLPLGLPAPFRPVGGQFEQPGLRQSAARDLPRPGALLRAGDPQRRVDPRPVPAAAVVHGHPFRGRRHPLQLGRRRQPESTTRACRSSIRAGTASAAW